MTQKLASTSIYGAFIIRYSCGVPERTLWFFCLGLAALSLMLTTKLIPKCFLNFWIFKSAPHFLICFSWLNVMWFAQVFKALFVFLKSNPKQSARWFLTPLSDPAFLSLSHGSLGFALHGSFYNHFLIGQNSSTANQNLWNKQLSELPWRRKC